MKTKLDFSLLKLTAIFALCGTLSLRAADATSGSSNSSSSNSSSSNSSSNNNAQQSLSADANSDTSAAVRNTTDAQAQANADASATANVNAAQVRRDWAKDQSDVRRKLNEQLSNATDFYESLQSKAETEIPSRVVVQAKGVLIINRWSAGLGVGATGGYAIGLKKMSDGNFSAPVFYSLAGASLGAQAGGDETSTIAFLMSDKAVRTLTDGKFVWSGNIKAVAGRHSSDDTTIDNTADVILYQKASGLDVGATVAATKVSLDETSTQMFYDNPRLRPDDVFSGKVSAPAFSKSVLTVYLTQQAHGIRPTTPANMAVTAAAVNSASPARAGVGVNANVQGTVGVTVPGALQTVGGVTAGVTAGVAK